MDDRITTAKEYHWATKHIRHRIKPHYLDFKNYPDQVKSYDFVKKIDLTKDLSNIDVDLSPIFIQPQSDQDQAESGRPFHLNTLSEILLLSYGVSRTGYANGAPFFSEPFLRQVGVYAVRENRVLLHNLMATLKGDDLKTFDTGPEYLLIFNIVDGLAYSRKNGWCFPGK